MSNAWNLLYDVWNLLISEDPTQRAEGLARLFDLNNPDLSIIAEEMACPPNLRRGHFSFAHLARHTDGRLHIVPFEEGYPVLMALLQERTSGLAVEGILLGLSRYEGTHPGCVSREVLEGVLTRTNSESVKKFVSQWLSDVFGIAKQEVE